MTTIHNWVLRSVALGLSLIFAGVVIAASTVPPAVQQPGTQPREVGNLESPDKCDNCHGGYNSAVEPAFNWRGSMMANAGRDAIFWATLAIAEQDFDGVGDLCIRCHSTAGWLAGRSTPTDGSGLAAGDADGVDCDTCHKMTNPDNTEHLGSQFPPFIANSSDLPGQATPGGGYYGSGMASLWAGSEKLGPYTDPAARHQFMQSKFHRSNAFCGTCHDVSNAVVGDIAHNRGTQPTGDPVVASGSLASSVGEKAAFNNFPFQYGVVERTWSEFMAGNWSKTRVRDFASLPAELKFGAPAAAFAAAGGDYADGTPRYFNCQSCHMRAVTGPGCNKRGAPVRTDLPLHDMTGGNYWMPDVIKHQNAAGTLRLGGGMTSLQLDALTAGKSRAEQQLALAARLTVSGDTLKVTNLTGHKLISGYPEGRRMWLRMKWFNSANELLHEDGKYGDLTVTLDGQPTTVRTLLNPHDPNTRVYEAHYAMTKEWASQLLDLGYSRDLKLAFDRLDGAVTKTLGGLADQASGTYAETFHFVLNNHVAKDNRIPPWGMNYEEARKRNALPVPASQYGPLTEGAYRHYDEVNLSPPTGATHATIELLYQPTSWEYIQFLYLANNRSNAFLANEGKNLLDSWFATGMAEPVVMASTTWGSAPPPPPPACDLPGAVNNLAADGGKRSITLSWTAGGPAANGGHRIYYDQAGKLQYLDGTGPTAGSYKDNRLSRGVQYCYVVTAWNDCDGNGSFSAAVDREGPPAGPACATAN